MAGTLRRTRFLSGRQEMEYGSGRLIDVREGPNVQLRPGIEARWQENTHLYFQGDYGIFYPGRFLKETQPGRNLNHWALWVGYKF